MSVTLLLIASQRPVSTVLREDLAAVKSFVARRFQVSGGTNRSATERKIFGRMDGATEQASKLTMVIKRFLCNR